MVRAAVAAILCAACQGQPAGLSSGQGAAGAGSAGSASRAPGAAIQAAGSGDATGSAGTAVAEGQRGKPGAQEPPDAGRVIAELGAIPAWQAVVDRAQLLGRRGQHGVVYGRVGPPILVPGPDPAAPPGDAGALPGGAPGAIPGAAIDAGLVNSPYVWLIDDTEGNGTLGIRIALGDRAKEGDRIAAGGAWHLDAERRWFWKADAVQPLPPAPPSDLKDPPPPVPSHAIATGPLPYGARTASIARDHDAVFFQIVGPPPASEGDGWQIADGPGSPIALVMNLPGERSSYGGQDMRSPDERWQLRRAQIYWVRIGKLHRHPGRPTKVNARTAPIRLQ